MHSLQNLTGLTILSFLDVLATFVLIAVCWAIKVQCVAELNHTTLYYIHQTKCVPTADGWRFNHVDLYVPVL